MNTTSSRILPYLITASAVLALIFILNTRVFVSSSMNDAPSTTPIVESTTSEVVEDVTVETPEVDDPFITAVPEEDSNGERKTEIFISSFDPVLGSRDANVYVILYGDFTDEVATSYISLFNELSDQYTTGDVAFVWKDYVAEENTSGRRLSEYGHCANEYDRFWSFAEDLTNRTADDDAYLLELIEAAGVQSSLAQECLDSSGYQSQIVQSYYAAAGYQVSNGHTIFVNDRLFSEPLKREELQQTIDEVLATYN